MILHIMLYCATILHYGTILYYMIGKIYLHYNHKDWALVAFEKVSLLLLLILLYGIYNSRVYYIVYNIICSIYIFLLVAQ